MVTTSGFASTPLSRALIFTIISTSILTSTLDIRHQLPIKPTPHLWPYLQFSRLFTFQLAYISSTELLFAVVLLYQMRVLERLWGARKFGSFVVTSWCLCGLGTLVLGIVMKILTLGQWGYIPPGLTALVVALVSVWASEVPGLYSVRVVTGIGEARTRPASPTMAATAAASSSTSSPLPAAAATSSSEESNSSTGTAPNSREKGILLSDKATTYLMVAQLSLSQFPYQLLPAMVGWVVGIAWREELLPMGLIRWRVPAWMVGETNDGKSSRGRQYEGLRRRLEEEGSGRDGMREVSDGVATRGDAVDGVTEEPRRGFGRGIASYFTGS